MYGRRQTCCGDNRVCEGLAVGSGAVLLEPGLLAWHLPVRVAEMNVKLRSELVPLLRSLRMHQWSKNCLVFVPLVLSGRFTDADAVINTTIAAVALCILASATYILNDIRDLADDRQHWSKRNRPLASGQLRVATATAFVPVAMIIALVLGALASSHVLTVLVMYLVITLVYTFWLKQYALIDSLVLAILYTVRLVLGMVAAQAATSSWLLVFSMFVFTSLSLAKRHAELTNANKNNNGAAGGRGYLPDDVPVLLALGVSTGVGGVLIMVLYIVEDAFKQSFYGNTVWLWGFPLLLFLFLSRIWLISNRGLMNEDPVEFALTDKFSLGLLTALLVCFVFAWFGPLWHL